MIVWVLFFALVFLFWLILRYLPVLIDCVNWILQRIANVLYYLLTLLLVFVKYKTGNRIGAALLAGLYPAWRVANAPPAVAMREE